MRNWKALAFAAVASTLLAGSLQAQGTGWVQWGPFNLTSSQTARFALSATPGQTWNVYTSPYKAQFHVDANPSTAWMPESGTPFGPAADIFCVDFFHSANQGSYKANFTNLGDSQGIADVALGTKTRSNDLRKYLAAAYLAEKIMVVGATSSAGKDINGAIWQIMSGSAFYRSVTGAAGSWVGGTGSPIQGWVDEAWAGASTFQNGKNWVVVTDQSGATQEYITHVTPEPATLLLLGTGLLATLMAAGALKRSAV